MNNQIAIQDITAFVYRCPLEKPVETSFGTMSDRPMVIVRVTDQDGQEGWGEVWCNFPMVGAEHRARLISSVFSPLLKQTTYDSPEHAFDMLTQQTEVLSLQAAEPGPFAQCIAGIDLALWDLCARRSEQPLWKYLGGVNNEIPVYASGLNPSQPARLAAAMQAQGYTRFKLKVGFGLQRDIENLQALRSTLGSDVGLMIDANQGWSLEQAQKNLPALERFRPGWIEEPLRCIEEWAQWKELQKTTCIPLAAGENILGEGDFQKALDSQVLSIIQPDVAKWGGISKCLPLAKAINGSGSHYYPHYLGGGIGLMASAHLLAAVGGEGALEIDSNPNPLRTELSLPLNKLEDGKVVLGNEPGTGPLSGLAVIQRYMTGEY
ncbi:mandelate racemase [Halomonas cupida]|uniref:L-alanine-DL-glutamate epimerase n=1 Tax=Halomonas cupida TaxID=44933 RepID=A0A1M7DXN0_9GAMM|nr:mandelate racemase/muconate lactonizing enzyme family protein [Halomonas cupida]GEN22934.1 mandelate racemase [Halomonas cupida]SHL84220.1 L-alanine-DL-glutamate epimerase [Halomonas cupida]